MGWETDHIHLADAGDLSCGYGKLCQLRGCAGILTVQLKEVAPLEQHQLIGMGFLDAVVLDNIGGDLRRFRFLLHGVQLRFFFGIEVMILCDQLVDALDHLRPGHQHIAAVRLPEPNTLAAVILICVEVVGKGVVAAADAVFFLQEIRFFLWRVRFLPVVIDSSFSPLIRVSAAEVIVDVVLRNEMPHLRQLPHFRFVGAVREVQIFNALQQLGRPVVTETQKSMILFPGLYKLSEAGKDLLPGFPIAKRFCRGWDRFGIAAAQMGLEVGKISRFVSFF